MKILNVEQIRALDKYTIEHEPISGEDLMERAASCFSNWYIRSFSSDAVIQIYCGIGNNGGDGLCIARQLQQRGLKTEVFVLRYSPNCSDDFQINYNRLKRYDSLKVTDIKSVDELPAFPDNFVIIDALWGSGLTRSIEGEAAALIKKLNTANALRIAVDVPSGLYSDRQSDSIKFKADFTFSFELPKLSFLMPSNYPYVGEWLVESIALSTEYLESLQTDHHTIEMDDLYFNIKDRSKFDHKGSYGHALLVAGSHGKYGAAVLASKACIKSGAGLVSIHTSSKGLNVLQSSVPEVMVIPDRHEFHISKIEIGKSINAIGIGPGLGVSKDSSEALHHLLSAWKKPIVFDADGINLLAKDPDLLDALTPGSVLTPHPKEFDRLVGNADDDYHRLSQLKEFAAKHRVIIVYKIANTIVVSPKKKCWFNNTGNPGMATAGSGDVLTGVITALMAQGYPALFSAQLGVYLHGLAGDYAAEFIGMEAMTSMDIIDNLDRAFMSIYY